MNPIQSRSNGLAAHCLTSSVFECRRRIREIYALPLDHRVGLGIERLAVIRRASWNGFWRSNAVELEPQWIGRFTVQIAAPSRSKIEEYAQFTAGRRWPSALTSFGTRELPTYIHLIQHHDVGTS